MTDFHFEFQFNTGFVLFWVVGQWLGGITNTSQYKKHLRPFFIVHKLGLVSLVT